MFLDTFIEILGWQFSKPIYIQWTVEISRYVLEKYGLQNSQHVNVVLEWPPDVDLVECNSVQQREVGREYTSYAIAAPTMCAPWV